MNWNIAYIIVVSCIALQSIVRDLTKLITRLSKKAGREDRAARLAKTKKRVAGIYEEDDE